MDEFGGIPVDQDEFGGIAVEEPQESPVTPTTPVPAAQRLIDVGINPAQYVAGGGGMAGLSLIPAPQDPRQSYISIPRVQGTTLPGQVGAAALNTASGFVEGMASPLGIATAGLGPLPKVGQAAIGAGFGVPAIKEGLRRVYAGTALKEPQEAIEGALQALTGGFITAGGVKALDGVRPAVKTMGEEIIPGEKGQTHNEIIKDNDLKPEDINRRTFVDTTGEATGQPGTEISRQELGQVIPTELSNKEAHSTDLAAAQETPPSALSAGAKQGEAPVSAAVEGGVQAPPTPQAMPEGGTPQTPTQAPSVTAPVTQPKIKASEAQTLKSLTEKLESGEPLSAAEKKRYRTLRDKATGTTQEEAPQVVASEKPKGIAASVRNKWTSATDMRDEGGFINLDPIRELVEKATPYVRGAVQFVKDLGREESSITRLNDYGRNILRWSGKLQRSFQEAADAQKEIQSKVPDKVRREGITNWIQAGGDANVLSQRLAATTDPKLRAGYEAAMNLTPEEVQVANDVKQAYDTLGQRGQQNDVLQNFKDNYVTQVWDLGKGPVVGGARNLRKQFRFAKASTFPTFFDGEQAGYTPKTKDISKLLPVYLHEMNFVIANRQLAEALKSARASDGLPLAVSQSTETPSVGDSRYRSLPGHPAIAGYKFHPEAYNKLSNVLGKSAIREWYSNRTSAAAEIPKALVRGLDFANSETKRTMLGAVAPFHQVQEGTHAVGHRVNPVINIPKVDLVNNPAQFDAAQHGLMLQPDRASAQQFMEGFRTSGLVSKIPGIGRLSDRYSNYLFHEYIPGLKYKTYEAIFGRNQKVYARELASGEVDLADVKHLSAEQTNAAYGHINYTDLARNPTIQHIMQLGLLAPDFLEARGRFLGQSIKGATGAKVGREQVIALATLALAQAATAYTSAKLTGGEWDAKRPFEFHVGNRRYTMRSVPEDVSSLLRDTRSFAYSRISPIVGKGALQYLTGTDWRGQKISPGETTKELLQQPIPISIRGFTGLGRQSLSGWEQLASAVGLRISRYSPTSDVFDMAHDWMAKSQDPKVQKRLEVQQHSVFPESEYKPLRNSLNDNNMNAARTAYQELLKTKTPTQVYKALSHPHPFTGKASDETKFVNSLNAQQRRIYEEALEERRRVVNKFQQLRGQ